MKSQYLNYAYLFVKEELQRIKESINTEKNDLIKTQLNNRKIELQNDLKDLEALIQ